MAKRAEVVTCPFTIICDNNEGLPYTFQGLTADDGRPLYVPTEKKSLYTGDYSILGWEDYVTVERKTLEDLYGSIGGNRDRFENVIRRMAEMAAACVVVEATMEQILLDPPKHSKVKPKTISRTMLSWTERYGVAWFTVGGARAGDRRLGEHMTFRFLEKFYEHRKEELIPKKPRRGKKPTYMPGNRPPLDPTADISTAPF